MDDTALHAARVRTPETVEGKIIDAEIRTSTDAARPLPLVCALYAIEAEEGVWLCAYYGQNPSVFAHLPQKGAKVSEKTLGIKFNHRELVPNSEYQAERWEKFKKDRFMSY